MKNRFRISLIIGIFLASLCTIAFIFRETIKDRFLLLSFYGPLPLDKVSTIALLPVHTLEPTARADYGVVDEVYYYYDSSSELTLHTYYVAQDKDLNVVRVARLSTCNLAGQLVMPGEVTDRNVIITWAKEQTGSTCNPLYYRSLKESILGEVYQSCFYWFGDTGYTYKLYTIWPEDKAVNFVNALVEISKDDRE